MTQIEQLNAIIGFCIKTPGWPHVLSDLGYMIERIELKFSVVDEAGKSRTINPDIVLMSEKKNFCLVFESKSGSVQQDCSDQLKRYSIVTKNDLIQKGAVTSLSPTNLDFNIVLIVNSEHTESYKQLIVREKLSTVLTEVNQKKVILIQGQFREVETNEVFRQGISIENQFLPMNFIPILPDSSDIETKERVVEAVTAFLSRKMKTFGLEQIMDEIFGGGLWSVFDNEAKIALREKIKVILKEMCHTEFSKYIIRRGGDSKNPIEWNLRSHPGSKRTRQFQALKKLKVDYISRLSRGEEYRGYNPGQDTLFALLEERETY
ncbi:MAG: hypothetical protein WCV79_02945 [Candidatus Paceibacterota bacterium]